MTPCGTHVARGERILSKSRFNSESDSASVYKQSGWRACVHKSGQSSTREPADSDLQGEVLELKIREVPELKIRG